MRWPNRLRSTYVSAASSQTQSHASWMVTICRSMMSLAAFALSWKFAAAPRRAASVLAHCHPAKLQVISVDLYIDHKTAVVARPPLIDTIESPYVNLFVETL